MQNRKVNNVQGYFLYICSRSVTRCGCSLCKLKATKLGEPVLTLNTQCMWEIRKNWVFLLPHNCLKDMNTSAFDLLSSNIFFINWTDCIPFLIIHYRTQDFMPFAYEASFRWLDSGQQSCMDSLSPPTPSKPTFFYVLRWIKNISWKRQTPFYFPYFYLFCFFS